MPMCKVQNLLLYSSSVFRPTVLMVASFPLAEPVASIMTIDVVTRHLNTVQGLGYTGLFTMHTTPQYSTGTWLPWTVHYAHDTSIQYRDLVTLDCSLCTRHLNSDAREELVSLRNGIMCSTIYDIEEIQRFIYQNMPNK